MNAGGPRGAAVGCAFVILQASCAPAAPPSATAAPPSAHPAPSEPGAAPRPPAARVAPAPGRKTVGIPALARADWPCAYDVEVARSTVRCTYTYDGARTRCLHQPDQWEPGCPARIACDVGPETQFEYDPRGRVTYVRNDGEGWATTWSDDSMHFEGVAKSFEAIGPFVESRSEALDAHGRIEFDDAGRPVLWREWRENGELWSEEQWTYASSRLVERRRSAGASVSRFRYRYDCR